MLEPLAELLAAAPDAARPFLGTEYPLPVHLALYGQIAEVDWLVRQASAADGVVAGLEPAMALAEAIESASPDRAEYFLTDAQTRSLVFTGAKWRAGWAFLVGGGVTEQLVRSVVAREFLAFCADPPADLSARSVRVPNRPTGVVYFLQLAVRYGMIYGRIAPGDAHELGHFLESDVPGVVVARAPLTPLESYLILGLMKLGLPAIVPSSFPYPQGRQVIADDPDDVLSALSALPNLRVKEVDGRTVRLPDYADPAHAHAQFTEGFEPARWLGGPDSFLFVRQDSTSPDGDTVVGQIPAARGEVGIVVGLADPRASDSVRELFEGKARAALGLLKGAWVRAEGEGGLPFVVELTKDCEATPEQMVETIRRSLQFQYPHVGPVAVRVSFDPDELSRLAPEIRRSQAKRRARVAALANGGDSVLYACTDCQPFSKEHVCFVGPTRPPMCGRDWRDIEAGALFGVGYYPYKRRADEARPNERPVPPGRCLDEARGEYEGVNAAVLDLSHGAVRRVFLHSVRDYPHTSCGCFHYLAFWIEEVGGLGVMHRGFAGRAPNGETWDSLANRAGGKQWPGVTGIGPAYLTSPAFLRGDGGLEAVVWMTAKARSAAGPRASAIATESEVSTLDGLIEHIIRRVTSRGQEETRGKVIDCG